MLKNQPFIALIHYVGEDPGIEELSSSQNRNSSQSSCDSRTQALRAQHQALASRNATFPNKLPVKTEVHLDDNNSHLPSQLPDLNNVSFNFATKICSEDDNDDCSDVEMFTTTAPIPPKLQCFFTDDISERDLSGSGGQSSSLASQSFPLDQFSGVGQSSLASSAPVSLNLDSEVENEDMLFLEDPVLEPVAELVSPSGSDYPEMTLILQAPRSALWNVKCFVTS
eukprot:TRINITY_DN78_c0_g1_i2.p3 TRINITY_DN78_c0_g1~~TRINITY_DN78_c0_g1_i2.p3  ORF type:complete len:225 (-),score=52.72 TRINITY_DN78_c0_g1_i2:3254-3928(-)